MGGQLGYYLLIEQPNKAFLRRNGLRDDGNLYKANWAGRGIAGQNEKRTNVHGTHDDLLQLIDQLESTKANPDEQWKVIQRQLNVEEVINHYAVRMLISDWDGFFNNYYLYHDLHGTGKWMFYPWDEDKTWGEYDGWNNRPLINMPLSYGSGKRPPPWQQARRASSARDRRRVLVASGRLYLPARAFQPAVPKALPRAAQRLAQSEFKEDRLFPHLDAMKERSTDEVRLRAEAQHEIPTTPSSGSSRISPRSRSSSLIAANGSWIRRRSGTPARLTAAKSPVPPLRKRIPRSRRKQNKSTPRDRDRSTALALNWKQPFSWLNHEIHENTLIRRVTANRRE